ncbi:MAG: UDP-2,3-diacylglucosamine diphosphatase [Flavobacteriales bacterium]|nr:UDP-2,3-diacylglucosamine diphosphatase [Flavobacteriales bacterium]
MRRDVDLVVMSDLHLGTHGCKANELKHYLNSIKPSKDIINGDINDIWGFKKSYFPEDHMKVVKKLIRWSADRPVYYITGNHDEALRKYSDFSLGHLHLVDELELKIDDKYYWFFHGDIFDASMQYAKWLAKMGGWGYDLLIRTNNVVNWALQKMGKPRMSFSKKIKNSVKKAVKYIDDFETTAAEVAIDKGFDYVVCGHIHQPQSRKVVTEEGSVQYLNSGDWIENLTSLEYHNGEWNLFAYDENQYAEVELIDRWKTATLKRVPA